MPHKTTEVRQVLQRTGIKTVYQPPNSPDPNVLDLKVKFSADEQVKPQIRDDFKHAWIPWNKMPASFVRDAINMQNEMCTKIIDAKGGCNFIG